MAAYFVCVVKKTKNSINACFLCKIIYNQPRFVQFWMRSSVGRATDS